MLVNGIVLTTPDWIEQNFGSFLNALEETVVFCATGGCFLIGMVTENLLSVSTFNLLFCSLVAIF